MSGHLFDLSLAAVMALVAISVGITGIRQRSRRHLVAAAAGLIMAGVLLYLHRSAFLS